MTWRTYRHDNRTWQTWSRSKGLLGLHAMTGCDTNSSFAGKRKLGAAKLLCQQIEGDSIAQTFAKFGESFSVTGKVFRALERKMCLSTLWGKRHDTCEGPTLYHVLCKKVCCWVPKCTSMSRRFEETYFTCEVHMWGLDYGIRVLSNHPVTTFEWMVINFRQRWERRSGNRLVRHRASTFFHNGAHVL